MTEWWTYTLSDFLLFSPRTYRRLVELYNAEVWPAHALALAAGALLFAAAMRADGRARRAVFALLGAAWLWVAWGFLWRHYATINWAAPMLAAAFALQGGLLAGLAVAPPSAAPAGRLRLALLAFALLGWPAAGLLLGRPWTQAELAGLVPEPTLLATLALLPAPRRAAAMLWVIPLAACAVSAATLWAMAAPDALLLPVAALLSLRAASARG